MLVILALACWIAPPVIAGLLFDPEEMPDEVYGMMVVAAWIFLLFPVGCVFMIAAWRIRRRTRQPAFVDVAGPPQRRPQGGCLSSAVPLAAIGFLTVYLWASITRDWRPGLLAAAPSVAAVVVAVRDHRAAQRPGAPRSWDLLALGIGIVTLAWWVAVVLGVRWPAG